MRRLLASAALGVLIVVPVAIPYALVQREAGARPELLSEAANNSAHPKPCPGAGDERDLWADASGRGPKRTPAPMALSTGCFRACAPCRSGGSWRDRGNSPGSRRVDGTVYVTVAPTGFILSLGPEGVRPLPHSASGS